MALEGVVSRKRILSEVIDDFLSHYQREFDYYQEVARLAALQCEVISTTAGIRAIVTHRAKRLDSLERKLRARAPTHDYSSMEAIQNDIVDLAGVRIALYFPGDREEVDKLLRDQFVLVSEPKAFPDGTAAPYKKRFDGYHAVHYRVRLKDSNLLEGQRRYADARVEIQVASVLMHAWAEVEHDLVYKPREGALSDDEYAILDELNGLVMSGEIALERLQKAMEQRVSAKDRSFESHYDLASYLYESARPLLSTPGEPVMGRVDILFQLLREAGMDQPGALDPFLSSLQANTEERPLAEQLIDLLLAAKPELYPMYSSLRAHDRQEELYRAPAEERRAQLSNRAVGEFMAAWITFERIARELRRTVSVDGGKPFEPAVRTLVRLQFLGPEQRQRVERVTRLRNELVHGIELPSIDYLREATAEVSGVIDQLANSSDENVRSAVSRVRADANR